MNYQFTSGRNTQGKIPALLRLCMSLTLALGPTTCWSQGGVTNKTEELFMPRCGTRDDENG